MSISTFALASRFRSPGSGTSETPIFREVIAEGATISLWVGSLAFPGDPYFWLRIQGGALPMSEWHLTDDVWEDSSWDLIELKAINDEMGRWSLYVRYRGGEIRGPFEYPSGSPTLPPDTIGDRADAVEVRIEAWPDAPLIYHDNFKIAQDWVLDGGAIVFEDDFETFTDPREFVPPWTFESTYNAGTDTEAAHVPDPSNPTGNTVAKIEYPNLIWASVEWEPSEPPPTTVATIHFRGGDAR